MISTVFLFLNYILSLKTDVYVHTVKNEQKNLFFVDTLKAIA
jgi:hypothetical protein